MSSSLRPILLAEDNANDVELVLTAFRAARVPHEIVVARDGAAALALLQPGTHEPALAPAVVVLDLKMPKVDGHEVLRVMRTDARLRHVPVVVLTSSREQSDLLAAYGRGINAYVVKPVEFDQFIQAVGQVARFWALTNEPPPSLLVDPAPPRPLS